MYTIFGIKFMKQANMRRVIWSLMPVTLAAIYFFGLRVLALMLVNAVFAVAAEYMFKRKSKKPVTEAAFVSAILYTLVLPARTPFWVGAVGIVFGIVFGKEVFGGFGRNVFNPALVARAFVYVSFPKFLTGEWTAPIGGFPGGFTKYLGESIDTLSTATPMIIFRESGTMVPYQDLLFGNIAGSLGETSALLIILAAAYLLITKTAFWENMLGMVSGFVVMTLIFNVAGAETVPNLLFGLLSGGFLFAMTFMVTDPITSAKTKEGKLIYGFIIGAVTVVIRGFALFSGGVMFAILIGNMFAPIIDEGVKALKKRKKRGAVNG